MTSDLFNRADWEVCLDRPAKDLTCTACQRKILTEPYWLTKGAAQRAICRPCFKKLSDDDPALAAADLIEWNSMPPPGAICAVCGESVLRRHPWYKTTRPPTRWVCGPCHSSMNGTDPDDAKVNSAIETPALPVETAPATSPGHLDCGNNQRRPDPLPVEAEILRALQVIAPAKGIVEVRAIGDGTGSGYYDTAALEKAAGEVAVMDGTPGEYGGIYMVLNEIDPALLSRRSNRFLKRLGKNDGATSDGDIVRRRWLPIDIDVQRPAGISSTDEEHNAALEAAGRIAGYLREVCGFPAGILADSGNGAHLLYRIDQPNDDASTALVKRCLQALGAAFDRQASEAGPGYVVDQSTFNPSRIWKLYGTMARKGDSTPDRPHRRSRILEMPATIEVVPRETLQVLAAQAPEEDQKQPKQVPRSRRTGTGPGIDLDEWLQEHGASLPAYREKSKSGFQTFYEFEVCPFDPSHRDRSAFVGQRSDGPLVAGCHHNGCSGRGWQDLRALVEPKRPKSTPTRNKPRATPPVREQGDHATLFTVSDKGKVRLDYQRIADILIAQYEPVTFNKTTWIYVDGLYRREAGEILSYVSEVARAAEFDGALTTAVREVAAYVSAYDVVGDHPFDHYPDALPLANGVLILNWEAGSADLKPYDPEYRFTRRWPVSYDPDADPGPVHDQALALYVGDSEVSALYQLPAQAILQFCGFGPFKKSYIFEGPTNGGKSTYIEEFLNRIFGPENIAGVSLQEIGFNRFVTGSLENRVINRCDDLADIPLRNVGPFKTLTGGFSHQIERKHEKDYPGRITAVHCFATNMPPEVPDNVAFDSAFWNRFVYLRFNNVFEVDPSFSDRVFTRAAMAGALNRILEMVFTIRESGQLPFDQDPANVKDEWQTAANPFERFVSTEMIPAKDPALFDKGKLFRQFLAWCDENEISPRKVPASLTGFTQLIFGSGFKPVRRGKKADRDQMYEARYVWKAGSLYQEMI